MHVLANPDSSVPIVKLGSTSFFWVREEDVYLVAATKCNANAALVFEFLYRFQSIWRSYFRAPLCEDAVKKNFVLVYELLDEVLDFGYPQNSDVHALKMYIANDDIRLEDVVRDDPRLSAAPAAQQVSWRRPDIRYRKNECFLDVIETVNLLISSQGAVLRADVDGKVMMRAHLSGMPECSVGLNTDLGLEGRTARRSATAVNLNDCTFHPCVQLDQFDQDRSIHFVPLDGDFELMRYRATANVKLPIKIQAVVEEVQNKRVLYTIVLRATLDEKLQATNVALRIPAPRSTSHARCSATLGKARYEAEGHYILWRIPKVQGGSEHTLHAEAELAPNTQPWARPPIEVHFSVMMFVASGLAVRYLKVVEKSHYRSVKWVRYVTRAANSYLVRI